MGCWLPDLPKLNSMDTIVSGSQRLSKWCHLIHAGWPWIFIVEGVSIIVHAYICFIRQPMMGYMRLNPELLNRYNDPHSKAKAGIIDHHYPVRDPDDVLSPE